MSLSLCFDHMHTVCKIQRDNVSRETCKTNELIIKIGKSVGLNNRKEKYGKSCSNIKSKRWCR